jgi:DNA (cytosine-5)-methyltransferase 1
MDSLKVGGGGKDDLIKVKSATKKGFEIAKENDSINLSQISSNTRRGRVGKEVAQTLDTACNQAVMIAHVSRSEEGKRLRREAMANGKKDFTPFQAKQISFKESDVMNCVTTATAKDNLIKIGAIRGRGNDNNQQLEINQNGTSNTITSVQKDNVVVYGNLKGGKWDKTHEQNGRVYDVNGIGATIHTMGGGNQEQKIYQDYKIRRLTPRECFRLMDFPDTFTWPVSNSQAYKQAGNSIVRAVLANTIEKLNGITLILKLC